MPKILPLPMRILEEMMYAESFPSSTTSSQEYRNGIRRNIVRKLRMINHCTVSSFPPELVYKELSFHSHIHSKSTLILLVFAQCSKQCSQKRLSSFSDSIPIKLDQVSKHNNINLVSCWLNLCEDSQL